MGNSDGGTKIMSSYFRADIEAMEGYIPGEQPRTRDWIKLNTNENPYPPSPSVREAILREIDKMRQYSDPLSTDLRRAAADLYGVTPEMIIAGNGSDDILNLLVRATAAEGEIVASFYPSYTLYQTLAQIQGAKFKVFEFTSDYQVPERLDLDGVKILFLPNPNAPSGTVVGHDTVRRLCNSCEGLVVIDEAYADFAEENCLSLLTEFDNLVITRTLSKSYSLAGLRVGFGIAAPPIIEALFKVKDSYNLGNIPQAAGIAALGDRETMSRNVDMALASRKHLLQGLQRLAAAVYPSQANFLLARFTSMPAGDIFLELKERKILVRYFNTPRLDDCLRISIGTDREINVLLTALEEILGQKANNLTQ